MIRCTCTNWSPARRPSGAACRSPQAEGPAAGTSPADLHRDLPLSLERRARCRCRVVAGTAGSSRGRRPCARSAGQASRHLRYRSPRTPPPAPPCSFAPTRTRRARGHAGRNLDLEIASTLGPAATAARRMLRLRAPSTAARQGSSRLQRNVRLTPWNASSSETSMPARRPPPLSGRSSRRGRRDSQVDVGKPPAEPRAAQVPKIVRKSREASPPRRSGPRALERPSRPGTSLGIALQSAERVVPLAASESPRPRRASEIPGSERPNPCPWRVRVMLPRSVDRRSCRLSSAFWTPES